VNDEVLLERSLQGDADAFRALYDRHAGEVYGYARRIVGDGAAAEDVSQEVFLTVVRRGVTFDRTRAFRPWLLTLVRNKSIDWLRARSKRPETKLAGEALEAMAEQVAASEAGEEVERALARLPLAYRETLWLCDALGLTYVEAGTILGCDPGTIGSRISRGRKALRDHYSRNGHEVR
jgi:RNA polymerase sigma-70 factor (ECF subfamily)